MQSNIGLLGSQSGRRMLFWVRHRPCLLARSGNGRAGYRGGGGRGPPQFINEMPRIGVPCAANETGGSRSRHSIAVNAARFGAAYPCLSTIACKVDGDGLFGRHERSGSDDRSSWLLHWVSHRVNIAAQKQDYSVFARGRGHPVFRYDGISRFIRTPALSNVVAMHGVDLTRLFHLPELFEHSKEGRAPPAVLNRRVPHRNDQ